MQSSSSAALCALEEDGSRTSVGELVSARLLEHHDTSSSHRLPKSDTQYSKHQPSYHYSVPITTRNQSLDSDSNRIQDPDIAARSAVFTEQRQNGMSEVEYGNTRGWSLHYSANQSLHSQSSNAETSTAEIRLTCAPDFDTEFRVLNAGGRRRRLKLASYPYYFEIKSKYEYLLCTSIIPVIQFSSKPTTQPATPVLNDKLMYE